MKAKRPANPAAAASPPATTVWRFLLLALGALIAVFLVYSPALDGPFLLDDLYLPFGRPDAASLSSVIWLAQRPLLGLTFWANYLVSGTNTFSYHAVNVFLHFLVSGLVFFIAHRLLRQFVPAAPHASWLAAFAALVFLLHPIQTEAVAYIASRSDVLSTLFSYAALALFVARRNSSLSLVTIATILVLFACAVLSKEQAAALPAAFFLIDWFAPDGKRNWRLHLPVFAAGVAGVAYVLTRLAQGNTAGFSAGISPLEYFYTQCRAVWRYIRLILLPVGQNVDPDFPLSRSLGDHLAWLGLLALIAAALLLLWQRRRFPLAAAGFFIFLAFLAPTSSFVPILDPVAERRVYFPFIGFLLLLLDLLQSGPVPISRSLRSLSGSVPIFTAILLLLSWLTYSRAGLWGSEIALWRDSVTKSPAKWRPRFQYAYALYHANQCAEAAAEFQTASTLGKPDPRLYIDWALALDCASRPDEAILRLQDAARLENTAHTQATIGMIYGKRGQSLKSLEALAEAERLDPRFPMTYVYRGNVYASLGRWQDALVQFERALTLEPGNTIALESLSLARRQLGLTP